MDNLKQRKNDKKFKIFVGQKFIVKKGGIKGIIKHITYQDQDDRTTSVDSIYSWHCFGIRYTIYVEIIDPDYFVPKSSSIIFKNNFIYGSISPSIYKNINGTYIDDYFELLEGVIGYNYNRDKDIDTRKEKYNMKENKPEFIIDLKTVKDVKPGQIFSIYEDIIISYYMKGDNSLTDNINAINIKTGVFSFIDENTKVIVYDIKSFTLKEEREFNVIMN